MLIGFAQKKKSLAHYVRSHQPPAVSHQKQKELDCFGRDEKNKAIRYMK